MANGLSGGRALHGVAPRGQPVRDGRRHAAGFGEVVRKQFRRHARRFGVTLRQAISDAAVELLPPAAQ